MALYETLIEGGHEHLIDAVKARIAQKADAIIEDELKPIIENQPSSTLTGDLLMADDVADLPPVMVHVDGRSEQVTTTGKNLMSDVVADWVLASLDGTSYRCTFVPVEAGASYLYHRASGSTTMSAGWVDGTDGSGFVAIASMSGYNMGYTFTNSDNHAYLVFYYASSTTAESAAGAMSSGKVQVEAGTSYSGYEKYSGRAASPRPDWLQEIVSVDELTLYIRGTNFFDISKLYSGDRLTVDGTTITANAGANLNIYDGKTGSHNQVSVSAIPRLPRVPAGQFAVRFSEHTGGTVKIRSINPSTGAANGHVSVDAGSSGEKFTTTQSEILSIAFANTGTSFTDLRINIVPGPSGYELYEGQTIPLYDGTLRSVPVGTKDVLTLTYLRPSAREGWAVYGRELVQRIYSVDLGSLNWTSVGSGTSQKYASNNLDPPIPSSWYSERAYMCDTYQVYKSVAASSSIPDNTIAHHATSRNVYVRDTRFVDNPDVAAFKAAVSGVIFDYILATPVTTQLDPIELPVLPSKYVTVWSDDVANLKLTYVIDSETIEESLESGIGKAFSSVAPVETSPATDSHGVGSRIVYNETLYKVTSAIAAGEDIVPGTNVTATTVAAELLATQA